MILKESFKVFVEADFEEGLFEESPFDGLVDLIVQVFSDDISQVMRFVGVDVFLFFNHEIQTNFSQNQQLVSGYLVMEFSQSRNSTRGPLIAVIKIEIDPQRTDRIFLHQRDNDLRLAQLFVQKHDLNSALIHHIHQRIQFSRQSVETQQEKTSVFRELREPNQSVYSRSNYKLQTPINHIDPDPQPNTEQQSFGTSNLLSDREPKKSKPPSRPFSVQEQDLFSAPHRNLFKENQNPLPAPSKKDAMKARQFMIYDRENEEDSNLFGVSKIQKKEMNDIPLPASCHEQIQDYIEKPLKFSEKKKKDALSIITQKEEESSRLNSSKSMMKLSRGHDDLRQVHQIQKRNNSLQKNNLREPEAKPCKVKVLKKEQIESLNQSLKKSMSKQQISRINRNVTKRLYNQIDIKKNYLQLIKKKAKQDKEKEIDTELTLRPKINKISQVIAQGRKKNDVPIEDYLIEEGKKAENKRNEINSRKIMKELENCSFKPELNIISQKLTADKQNFQSRLKEQNMKKSSYKDPNTFRPSLNKITQELMKDRGTFEERQKQYLEVRSEKLMEMVHDRMLGEKIDLQTGQELFKPIINDIGVREKQGTNIGDYLFQMSKQQSEKIEKSSPRPRISQSSQLLVEQMNMKRITWLFGELDSDQDGVISAQKICIDTISPQILSIIKPILFEMEEINEELTLLEFKNAIDILHKKLNVNEKGILYNYYNQKCK